MADETKPALLVSDAERERGIALLRDAVVDGRLTLAEFSERVSTAQLVRTEPELSALVADLPSEPRSTDPGDHRRPPSGGLLEARPQRTVGASPTVVVSLDLRHDRSSTCGRRRCTATRSTWRCPTSSAP